MKKSVQKIDCAVIGGGFAGCSAALELAEAGKKVDIFVKGDFKEDCNSWLCAGGFASVPLKEGRPFNGDSFKLHIKDTLKAGSGLNNRQIVSYCVEHFYPDVIEWLISKGVKFDRRGAGDGFDLNKEGGHSASRVFHHSDTTGVSIMEMLLEKVNRHPKIKVHAHHTAIDLITKNRLEGSRGKDALCGFYIYDNINACVKTVACKSVFIATGGLGKVFMYTSNPDIATGDGFAICYRAGLKLVNMEFVQFHPTVYYDPSAANESGRRFLLTEALRGAGAFLKLKKDSKEDFVLKYDPLGSKSTRDVVTKAEDVEMRKNGLECVWLDCTRIPRQKLKTHFKNSYEFCLGKGLDMARDPVPVVYAEHYSNGGVQTGKHGETEIKGVYVVGETAYTGLHGATRLASNSGPECILFGRLAAKHYIERADGYVNANIPLWDDGKAERVKDKTAISYYWETVRRTMTLLCGISRNWERLSAAKEVMETLNKNIRKFYWNYYATKEFLEVRNIATVSLAILQSALARNESRACHFREDFPKEKKEFLGLTVVQKKSVTAVKK